MFHMMNSAQLNNKVLNFDSLYSLHMCLYGTCYVTLYE